MGLSYNVYLNSDKIFGCKNCKTHLASHDSIISRVCFPSPYSPQVLLYSAKGSFPRLCPLLKPPYNDPVHPFELSLLYLIHSCIQNFRGQHGKAFLFNTVVNTTQSEAVERNMTTGRHQVRDVNCKQCKETVGWKYDKAYEASEKYKEGKFILEAELLCTVY